MSRISADLVVNVSIAVMQIPLVIGASVLRMLLLHRHESAGPPRTRNSHIRLKSTVCHGGRWAGGRSGSLPLPGSFAAGPAVPLGRDVGFDEAAADLRRQPHSNGDGPDEDPDAKPART